MLDIAALYSALGDETRLKIIDMLQAKPMAAGAIADRISTMSRPAVVKHINILRTAGLITTTKDGRTRINALNENAIDEIGIWLAERGVKLTEQDDDGRPPKGLFLTDKPSKLLSARKKR